MKRHIIIAVLGLIACVAAPVVRAHAGGEAERETVARGMQGAWLPLESGLVISAREGTPLSAKYEVDDGEFQLSVYTVKSDPYSGDVFTELIVDFNTGMVTKVVAITGGNDLAAAQTQKTALTTAKRSVAEATETVVQANTGYRAVSATPGLVDGRPILEITLVRGSDWKVVGEGLD
jgi:hypothetical protein